MASCKSSCFIYHLKEISNIPGGFTVYIQRFWNVQGKIFFIVHKCQPYICATSLQVLEGDRIFDLSLASVKYSVTFQNLQAGDKIYGLQ